MYVYMYVYVFFFAVNLKYRINKFLLFNEILILFIKFKQQNNLYKQLTQKKKSEQKCCLA